MSTEEERSADGKIIVHSYDHVPSFASASEEAAFWDTHELSPKLMTDMQHTHEEGKSENQ